MESIRHSSLSLRAEPGAVVEGGAAIPCAVPGLALERLRARRRAWARQRAARSGSRLLRQRREQREGAHQQPAEPDALAAAVLRRPGSCRRSSRRCRSAAGRARRSAEALVEAAGAVLEQRAPPRRRPSAGRTRRARRAAAAGRRGRARSRRGPRRRRSRRHSSRRRRPARRGRRRCACARPGPEVGSHQCCTSPSTNWRAAARSRCVRASPRAWRSSAPCRPGAGRGSRRRRSPGRTPSAPRCGRPASGRAASRSA